MTIEAKEYLDLKARHQAEFDAFISEHCFFAFSKGQFDEGLEKLGLADGLEVSRFAAGGFVRASKADDLAEIAERQGAELREAMRDPEFAYRAFVYEMGNHEYHINLQGDWDVCECFFSSEYDEEKGGGDYLREAGCSEEVVGAYRRARRDFLGLADESGWY